MDKQTKIKRDMHEEIIRLRAALDAMTAERNAWQRRSVHSDRLKAEAERDAARAQDAVLEALAAQGRPQMRTTRG